LRKLAPFSFSPDTGKEHPMQTVLKFFAGILSLAASRKIFIAVVAAGIALLNEKLGLNLPIEALAGIVVLAVGLIIAIAMEDSAAKKREMSALIGAIQSLIQAQLEKSDVGNTAVGSVAAQPDAPGAAVEGSDAD
jgi:hypothetical protein